MSEIASAEVEISGLTTDTFYGKILKQPGGRFPQREANLPYEFNLPPVIFQKLRDIQGSGSIQEKGEAAWTAFGLKPGTRELISSPTIWSKNDYSVGAPYTYGALLGIRPLFLVSHSHPSLSIHAKHKPKYVPPGFSVGDIFKFAKNNRGMLMFAVLDQYGYHLLTQTRESMKLYFSTMMRGLGLTFKVYDSWIEITRRFTGDQEHRGQRGKYDQGTIRAYQYRLGAIFAGYNIGYYVATTNEHGAFENNFRKAKFIRQRY